jgi:flagellar hook-associated protein 1 FlgK
MSLLSVGITGLKVHQTALAITGHNIANTDTEGYSRQRVNFQPNKPLFLGGNWVGAGVQTGSIERIHDEFLVGQLRRDVASYNRFDTLATNAGSINSLLADTGTGIQPVLESFFAALEKVNDDPSSTPARQVLISEGQGVVDRFNNIYERFVDQNNIINGQMGVLAGQITTLAESIANINALLVSKAGEGVGSAPPDLLDERDRLLRSLSEKVDVSVSFQDDLTVNVSIGNGQGLVIGNEFNRMIVSDGELDANRKDLFFVKGGLKENITDDIIGGELGGTLEFRDSVLDPSFNQLGRLAIALGELFNQQHRLGLDLDGSYGQNFFSETNTRVKTLARVIPDDKNALPQDRLLSLDITNVNELQNSEYDVRFTGPGDKLFTITRLSDGEEIIRTALSGEQPQSFEFDGLRLNFESGSFQQGDRYLLSPTRFGARDIEKVLDVPEEIAVASPIETQKSVGNLENTRIRSTPVTDLSTDIFSVEGSMNPPLLIRFNSENRYDVLDNTDPGNPIPLFPPLSNLPYTPGIKNLVLPIDEGKTAFTSFGGVMPDRALYQAPPPAAPVTATNGFFPENIIITRDDPSSLQSYSQPLLTTPANASARELATLLSAREGVEAFGRTTLQISNFVSDSTGASLENTAISLNGIILTDTLGPNQTKYASDYPVDVPNPLTPNFVADRINANYEFQEQGIVARSDGEKVTIIATNGEDLSLEMSGDPGDGFSVSNGQDIALKETGMSPVESLNEFEGYDFSTGGPYSYEFDVPGRGVFSITLTGNHATGADVVNEIEEKIESSGFVFRGEVDVSINERGQIRFQERLPIKGTGPNGSQKFTMGGQVKIITDPNYRMDIAPPGNNLFPEQPVGKPVYFGFNVEIEGQVQAGDEFTVDFNQNATADNRNGLELGNLVTKDAVNGNTTLSESYAQLVEEIGSVTSRAQISLSAAETLFRQSELAVTSLSGVNLDEEAAKLIQYELGYNASAQVIQVAQSIFDTLIAAFR